MLMFRLLVSYQVIILSNEKSLYRHIQMFSSIINKGTIPVKVFTVVSTSHVPSLHSGAWLHYWTVQKKIIAHVLFFYYAFLGSRGSRHSTDSGTTSDSNETRDTVFDDLSSPFRSDLEASPPMTPTTPPLFQKGAYISKVRIVRVWKQSSSVFTTLL